jgi:hypothetical protein
LKIQARWSSVRLWIAESDVLTTEYHATISRVETKFPTQAEQGFLGSEPRTRRLEPGTQNGTSLHIVDTVGTHTGSPILRPTDYRKSRFYSDCSISNLLRIWGSGDLAGLGHETIL